MPRRRNRPTGFVRRSGDCDMAPVIGRDGGRIDPQGFDAVDHLERGVLLRPAVQMQQDFGTRYCTKSASWKGFLLLEKTARRMTEAGRDGPVLIPAPRDRQAKDGNGGEIPRPVRLLRSMTLFAAGVAEEDPLLDRGCRPKVRSHPCCIRREGPVVCQLCVGVAAGARHSQRWRPLLAE